MKQPIKQRQYKGAKVTVVLLCLVVVFCLFYKPPVRSYHEKNPTPFNIIVDFFSENPLDKPVFFHRNNILGYGWNDMWANEILSQEVKDAIISIFWSSDCKNIHISMWDGELDYCSFYTYGEKIESGIAFLPAPGKKYNLLGMRLVRQCTPIADNWVYYEVYTPLGEKDFPY